MTRRASNRSVARRAREYIVLAALAAFSCPAAHALAANCTASATGVAFGTYTPLTIATSTATITISCTLVTAPAPATITLSAGASNSFAARTMTTGGKILTYNLYVDAAHTQIWGDGTGGSVTDTINLTPGLFQTTNATVYGLVPSQDPAPGAAYADTITVTVSY
jgi:spore coat protein U-like protein